MMTAASYIDFATGLTLLIIAVVQVTTMVADRVLSH